jgi:hypothetical protein
MLNATQIKVGGFYVSEKKGLVREVWKEENGDVHWRSYEFGSGEATGDNLVCSKNTLVQWADREATLEELARMKRTHADIKDMARTMELVEMMLHNISDERLLAEVRRRGLTVNKPRDC